jgi:hypothetical protein
VAVPELSVPVPSEVVPLLNVIVPVAVVGETVAVSVMLVPTVVVVEDDVSVTVVAVDPVGASQKSPHPVPNPINNGATSPKRIRVLPLRVGFNFITTDPFSQLNNNRLNDGSRSRASLL